MDALNKLVAYHPAMAKETKKGIARDKTASGKYIVHFFDGTIKELEPKEFTLVWNKLDPNFVPW